MKFLLSEACHPRAPGCSLSSAHCTRSCAAWHLLRGRAWGASAAATLTAASIPPSAWSPASVLHEAEPRLGLGGSPESMPPFPEPLGLVVTACRQLGLPSSGPAWPEGSPAGTLGLTSQPRLRPQTLSYLPVGGLMGLWAEKISSDLAPGRCPPRPLGVLLPCALMTSQRQTRHRHTGELSPGCAVEQHLSLPLGAFWLEPPPGCGTAQCDHRAACLCRQSLRPHKC